MIYASPDAPDISRGTPEPELQLKTNLTLCGHSVCLTIFPAFHFVPLRLQMYMI